MNVPVTAVFASVSVVVAASVLGAAIVGRQSPTPVAAASQTAWTNNIFVGSSPSPHRELLQMQTWWTLTQSPQARTPHSTNHRKRDTATAGAQQTWAPVDQMPETPKYLPDTSRWPLHGPASAVRNGVVPAAQ